MGALKLTSARTAHLSTPTHEGVFTGRFTPHLHTVYRKHAFKAVVTKVKFTFCGSTVNMKKLLYMMLHVWPHILFAGIQQRSHPWSVRQFHSCALISPDTRTRAEFRSLTFLCVSVIRIPEKFKFPQSYHLIAIITWPSMPSCEWFMD